MIVSLFGMVNTLVLAVYERTRELGMLRAVGMTRRQARRMIRHESVITALIGAAMGIPLGVFLAALITQALSKYGVGLQLPVTELVVFTAVAIVAGRAGGDHPRAPGVAHQRAQRPAVRVGRRGRAAHEVAARPSVRLRGGGAQGEGQRLGVRARAQRVVGVDQLAEAAASTVSLETGPL